MIEKIYCPWEASEFLLFSSNVPDLVHYSHGVAIMSAFIIAFAVFANSPKSIVSRLFLLFATFFSLWAILDIFLWATNNPSIVMFAWSLQVLLEPLTYATAFFLYYNFLTRRNPGMRLTTIVALTLLPLILFLPTNLNLQGLILSSCESIEGPLAKYYSYFANTVLMTLIVMSGIRWIPKLQTQTERRTAIYFGFGLITFLAAFTSGNVISSFTDNWEISQYGLFGMPIFAALIAYAIVKYNAFNVKIVGAQALMVTLWVLVGSLLLVVQSPTSRLVAAITLAFTTVVGLLLIRSVAREIKQRVELEKLTNKLADANERLKQLDKLKSEFVSIASHQMRSPLTSIRGYSSMLIEQSFGPIPEKAMEPLKRIDDSARHMAMAIEDYLNVSRIESGNMKYNNSDFNLKDETEKICDDIRPVAMEKKLVLLFRTDLKSRGIVNADIGKTIQILHNIINNSMKYTPKGSITVYMRDDVQKKRIYVDVTDTGIGISKENIEKLFQKFSRATNANSVNVSGTGLGLFVARQMAVAMGGDITAKSEGDGKGSTFTFELPLMM